MISCEEIREHLSGPIASLNTVFNRDGSIDYGGLCNLTDADIAGGSKTMLLTDGDSLFSLLTDNEIVEVTRVVGEHTGDRAMMVAADSTWWTGKSVEFANPLQSGPNLDRRGSNPAQLPSGSRLRNPRASIARIMVGNMKNADNLKRENRALPERLPERRR